MLLQEQNDVLHGTNQFKGMIFNLTHIPKMSHDFRQKLLFFLGISLRWDDLDSLVNLIDKGNHVFNAGICVD